MTRRVVDASVAMKWIVNEPGSAAALRLRREHRLLAPDLIFCRVRERTLAEGAAG